MYTKNVALLHYVIYTLTTDTITHVTSFFPMPPANWSVIILLTAHVFITPIPSVPVKITVPPIILTVRPAIIDNALSHSCRVRGGL